MRRAWRFLVWMLDLADSRGDPDFGKFMQAGTQLTLLALLWTGGTVPFSLGLALIISAHGTRVLLAALKSGVFHVGATVVDSRAHTISEMREPNAFVDDERGEGAAHG